MSTNWRAGDKAVCVDDSPPENGIGKHLTRGTIYLVVSVVCDGTGLCLGGVPDLGLGWWQHRFRKVVPACDRNEREQTELMPHAGFWENRP